MFCLVTRIHGLGRLHPALNWPPLYALRWDGSETSAARGQGAAARRRAGHRADAALLLPGPGRQEIAAWAAGTGMTRGVVLDAARAAVPARK